MRAWLWLWLAACGTEPPRVTVTLNPQNVPNLAELARLELRVERCGKAPVMSELSQTMNSSAELGVTPGERFMVWVRGWQFCNPPCEPEASAGSNACVCRDPRPQTITAEACSAWITAANDANVQLTLTPVEGRCPPPPDCN